jgi:acyl transferase domain-containing protein
VQAHKLAHQLRHTPHGDIADVCFTGNAGRAHFAHRLALVVNGVTDARLQLEQLLQGNDAIGQRTKGAVPQVAVLFGDGAVPRGAGRALYEQDPESRRLLDACDSALRPHLGGSLLYALHHAPLDEARELLARPSYAHAASASLHYVLYELWRRWGVVPAVVYGAGAGEYGAAAACGVIPFEEAVVRATRRGTALEGLQPNAQRVLTPYGLRSELAALAYGAPQLALVSASLGRAFAEGEGPEAVHFRRQLYHVPAPDDGREALLAQDCAVWLELGIAGTLALGDASAVAAPLRVASLSADEDDMRSLLRALTALYMRGVELDLAALDAPYARRRVALPPYPFERERYWLELPRVSADEQATQAAARASTLSAPVVQESRPISTHPMITRMRVHQVVESGIAPAASSDDESTGTGS